MAGPSLDGTELNGGRISKPRTGHRLIMTDRSRESSPLDLSGVAAEKPEEAIAVEQEIVDDQADGDSGDTVPEDGAQ